MYSFVLHCFVYAVSGRIRQCDGPVFRRPRDRIPLSALLGPVARICTMEVALMEYCDGVGTALCRVVVTASQLDLPSLTPLSVAGCGRLQLEAEALGYCSSSITASS